ncbi:hypothetical protein C9I57_20865 [Trinickia symbiotica]|uniref:Uncharacterized protein n=1 Tax=Trinickia symbiotica TaxID=863227 RepID=A0A2T3XQZ3_9BURK|nr:hypothetical protein [Trinickia symbiotica]PTB18941.1 hypothetical protein C9I57_20865 [Trinickia symbiotica]
MSSQIRSSSQGSAAQQEQETSVSTSEVTGKPHATPAKKPDTLPSGPAAAAILAAGIGCFAVGMFALAGDALPAVARLLTFCTPTGPLSGVTTSAIVVWLLSWFALARKWHAKTVALGGVTTIAFILLTLSVLLTFPPFMDLLQGK